MGVEALISTQVVDTTTVGRSLMTTTDATAARTTLGIDLSGYLPLAGGAMTGQLLLGTGTITTSKPLALAQTWNNAATVFSLLTGNITRTAANSSSKLIDITATVPFGDTSPTFRVGDLNGDVVVDGIWGSASLTLGTVAAKLSGIYGQGLVVQNAQTGTGIFTAGWGNLISNHLGSSGIGAAYSWGSSIGTQRAALWCEAAQIVALRNGTNAQTFRVSNTWTSATSYETLQIQANTGAAYRIGSAVGSAGGTNRAITFGHWNTAGTFVGTAGITTAGRFSDNAGFTEAEIFGVGATGAAYSTLFGYGAASTGSGVAVVFGGNGSAGSQSAAFGYSAVASGSYSVALGNYTTSSFASSIALGRGAVTGKVNQLVIGATGADGSAIGAISEVSIGGNSSATPYGALIASCSGSGTNIAGASFTLAGGKGAGTGAGGSLVFQTAPAGSAGSALNSLVTRLTVDSTGLSTFAGPITLTQPVSTTGSPTAFALTGAAHTTLALSTEATDVNFNLARTVEFATGALTTQRAVQIQAPTYSFVGASTITTASTLSISGPPIAGTNATITNAYALNVEGGKSNFSGNVDVPSASTASAITLSSTVNSSTAGVYLSAKNGGGGVASSSLVINGGNGVLTLAIPGTSVDFASFAGTAQLSTTGTLYIRGSVAASLQGGSARVEVASGAMRVRDGTVSLGEMSGSTNWAFNNLLLNGKASVYTIYTSATSYETLNLKGKTSANFEIGPENGSAGGTLRGLTIGGYALGSATITGWLQFRPNATTAALEAFYLGPIADNTTVGGNARGANSVDLQTARTTAAQVASGSYSFVAGYANTNSGQYGTALGRLNNVSGLESPIAIGDQCTTSGYTPIAIGYICTASGTYGQGNLAIGKRAVANYSGEPQATAIGTNVSATNAATFASGSRTVADRMSMQAHSQGMFAAAGDAQSARFVLRKKTTDATPTTLMLDGSTTRLTIPSGKIMFADILISGIKSDGSAAACYKRKVAIKNVGGTTTLVGTVETIGTDIEDNAACDVAITADDTNDALDISVTGIAAETWRWVAVVEGLEIGYGT